MPDETRPPWRPTDYKPEFCQMLVDHMAKGFSFESFGAIVDCGKTTLYRWIEANEDFRDALDRGRNKHLLYMESVGQDHIVESFQGNKVNTGLYKLFMANIHGWREKTESEVKTDATINIILDADESSV